MEWTKFSNFVEFKNTKEGKKVDESGKDGELKLSFRKVKQGKLETIRVGLNPGLVKSLKENKIFSFKLLFNESSLDVCLRYDTSSNAFTIVNKKIRARGEHEFYNKYITAVMMKVLKDKNAKAITYKGKYYKESLAYCFSISKVSKAD